MTAARVPAPQQHSAARGRRRFVWIGVVLVLLPFLGGGLYLWRSRSPVIDKIAPPARAAFTTAAIDQGAALAALGNCELCHTAPGGSDYAGNRPIPTPFGTVYSTNITPADSGIGHWSQAAFSRAMRRGISRRGRNLYPAFPYDHFTRLSEDDIHALYAFLMTRPPVEIVPQANALWFPFSQRWLMRFWNILYFEPGPFRPDPAHDAGWNRGRYLVEGLGHCGDCHTPRTLLSGEESGHALAGSNSEGWTAPALGAASSAPVPWTKAELFDYLHQGWDKTHGAAAGPMQGVSESLAAANPADLHAIADYLASLQPPAAPPPAPHPTEAPAQPAAAREPGAAIFAGACAECHEGGTAMLPPHGIELSHSTAIAEEDPDNAIRIVLGGRRPATEEAGPYMPGFADALSDQQIAAVLAYVRAHDANRPAWNGLESKVQALRQAGGGT